MRQLEPGLEFLPGLTLVRRLGRGGMGEAWVARDASRGEEVVAKVLPADAPEERVALLRREARLVRKVQHPGIVPVHGFVQGPHGSAVILRYLRGGDAGRLRGAPPIQIVRVARAVAEALGHLHALGVVHRDVKPTNVLLDAAGRGHLADFGIAAVAHPGDDEGLTLHGGGSRASMSPQQRAGEPAQPADDIYALGVLLHELLAGRPPFAAGATDEEMSRATPILLEPAHPVPDRLRTLIASMLARSPADRPRDAKAVADALREIEGELATPGPDVSAPPAVRLQPPPRVPDVGVVATPSPPPRSPTPAALGPGASRQGSPARVMLFAALGLAVLFVVLVLPRWAQAPRDRVSAETAEPTGPPPPEAAARPAAPAEATPVPAPPAEATPVPAPGGPPAPAASRPRPPASAPREPVAEPAAPGADEEFASAMSAAQAALDRKDWPAAREALARAGTLRPGSSALADARRRAEDGERAAALAEQREKAQAFEAREDWRRAQTEYEAALKLDPVVTFALEGRRRAKARADLADRIDFHVAHPLRLATDAVAREAERLLQQAREVSSPGPRLRGQIAALETALALGRTPVAVTLESDGETDVVVHKVGRLGAFTRKSLELRPGTYTVVGTRPGYRDVRRQLVIEPAATPPALVVRCEEAI